MASFAIFPLSAQDKDTFTPMALDSGFGHMDLTITIDDPKAYTKPWTVVEPVHLLPDTELLEFICNENNRYVSHLPGQ